MASGAVLGACELVRAELLDRAAAALDVTAADLTLAGPAVCDAATSTPLIDVSDLLGEETVSHEHTFHHRPTDPIDDERGQGDAHVAFAYAAHRAVVDVDVELGLVRVVEMATAQDVGTAMNPIGVEGQLEGGAVQGLGLALMEELQISDGRIRRKHDE